MDAKCAAHVIGWALFSMEPEAADRRQGCLDASNLVLRHQPSRMSLKRDTRGETVPKQCSQFPAL